MQTAGFVLVGGFSSRMGRDKALLPSSLAAKRRLVNSREKSPSPRGGVAGRLLETSHALAIHVAAKVAVAAGNVALVGAPERYRHLGLDCIADRRPGSGPLAGIEAALESRRGEWNFIVACDMPGLKTEWLTALLRAAREAGAPCLLARDKDGIVHPLCGVYRIACLPAIRNALDAGRLKLFDVVNELGAATLTIDESIWNVNTPEEWMAWQNRVCPAEGVAST